MKQLILLVVVAVVLVGVVVFLYSRDIVEAPTEFSRSGDAHTPRTPTPTPTVTPLITETTPVPLPTVSKITVTYSDSGYSPAEITVKKGDTVVFINRGSKMMWTASAVHPTHKVYPSSDIAKCGTPSQNGIFDACKGYEQGESWEFKFNETGTWKYHNHLQSTHTGTIMVE